MFDWLFGKKDKPEQVSLIGQNVGISKEKITFRHQLIVNGTVHLQIEGSDPGSLLFVSEPATVIGDVCATDVVVGGTVQGNVNAENIVEVTATGKVIGDVVCKRLDHIEGGKIEGRITTKIKSDA